MQETCNLYSHLHNYPRKYEDGRISSATQQVNCHDVLDSNSYWEVLPLDNEYFPNENIELTADEKDGNLRFLRHNDYVRLRHVETNSYLITHDVASPLVPYEMEVTTVDEAKSIERYNETVWQIRITQEKSNQKGANPKVISKKTAFLITNFVHKVSLHSSKSKLPEEWGFNMKQISGNKKTRLLFKRLIIQKLLFLIFPKK